MRNWMVATAIVLGLAGSSAEAATYNLNFQGILTSGYSFDVLATVTTGATAPSGGFDITSITGTDTVFNSITNKTSTNNIQSSAGTGLVAATSTTPPAQGTYYASNGLGWYYNDVLYPSGPQYVDNNGPLFGDSSGNILNLYWSAGTYYLSVDNPGGTLWDPGDPGSLSVSQAPLPSSWTLLISGFIGFGLFTYRNRKSRRALRVAA